MNERIASRLIQAGVAFLALAVVTGLLIGTTRVPRLALSVHVTMLISGVMLIGIGTIWPRLALTARQEKVASNALIWGAAGNWAVGMTAAYLGVGGGTLSLAAGDAVGGPLAERLLAGGVAVVVLATTTGLGLVLWGVRAMVARPAVERRPWSTRRKLAGAVGVVALAFLGIHAAARGLFPPIDLPAHEEVAVTWVDQNWSEDDWQWFYHTSQGGALELPIPYEWLLNLEQPRVPFLIGTRVPRFMDPSYVSRFGFLPNPATGYDPAKTTFGWAQIPGRSTVAADAHNNPDGLPVGFVRTPDFFDRASGHRADMVGFTCAACHTGQLNYGGKGIRIEGGSAMTDLGKFRRAVGMALALTYVIPSRFGRFADAVLGDDRSPEETEELKAWMKNLIGRGKNLRSMLVQRGIYPTEEGFGRLDAIGRIGNFVFGSELDDANFAVSDAPVSFPPIWDTPWFEWVQYNASFKQPMMRNAGEAMGVFASVNFRDVGDDDALFRSSMNIINLHEMESLIRGDRPYAGLRSPTWPEDVLGAIDTASASRGAKLYQGRCQGCHLVPMTDSAGFFAAERWTTADEQDNRYLKLHLLNIADIGTDPNAAVNFYQRIVRLGALGEKFADSVVSGGPGIGPVATAGAALPFLIRMTAQKRYADLDLPDSLRSRLDGHRKDEIQALLVYKARPLNGIWATPPFLHNGSVPSVFQLLGPPEERDDVFELGTKDYDPVHLGYVNRPVRGGFVMDTSLPGNSNRGHEFRGSPTTADPGCWRTGGPGVIGCALDQSQRLDIIEYLKTLPGAPGGSGTTAPSGRD